MCVRERNSWGGKKGKLTAAFRKARGQRKRPARCPNELSLTLAQKKQEKIGLLSMNHLNLPRKVPRLRVSVKQFSTGAGSVPQKPDEIHQTGNERAEPPNRQRAQGPSGSCHKKKGKHAAKVTPG